VSVRWWDDSEPGAHTDFPDAVVIDSKDKSPEGYVRYLRARSSEYTPEAYHLVVMLEPIESNPSSEKSAVSCGLNLDRDEASALAHSLLLYLERTAE
jgi:hypothetical protein